MVKRVEKVLVCWDCGSGHNHKDEQTANRCAERRLLGKKSSRIADRRLLANRERQLQSRRRYFVSASLRHDDLAFSEIGKRLKVGPSQARSLAIRGRARMDRYFEDLNSVAEVIQQMPFGCWHLS